MAHTKTSGRARQGTPRKGNRLGIKVSGGQSVNKGQIILRQRGSTFRAGEGTKMGRDFTIFAIKSGVVEFKKYLGKKLVTVK